MRAKSTVKHVRTTLGDLIVAVFDAALDVCHDERRAYRLTDHVLNRMLLRPVPVTAGAPLVGVGRKRMLH